MTTILGPTDEQVRTMRQNVMSQIEAAESPSRETVPVRRKQPMRRIAFGVAALTAAAAVVAVVVVPSGHDAPAQAADVLRSAADLVIAGSDPVVASDQFLRIETQASYAIVGQNDDGDRVAWLAPQSTVVYKPADAATEWVMERRQLQPTKFYGEGAESAAMDDWAISQGDKLTNGVFRGVDGAFYGLPNPATLTDELPRDAAALYEYIRDGYVGGSNSIDEDSWVRITELLRTGTAPADLRSALYGAAAMIPGIEITDDQATLNGRTGIAVGRVEESRDERQDIIVDPATGEMIGERTVRTTADFGAPAGAVWAATSVTTTVVDSAP